MVESSPSPRGRLRNVVLSMIGLTALAASGAVAWKYTHAEKAPVAASTPLPVPVETLVVTPQTTNLTRIGLGTVQGWDTATITPEVSGEIIEMPFREGGTVKAGDVLVRIDPRPFQAALDQAKAREAQDQANLVATQKNLVRDQTLLAKGVFATQQTVDNEQAQVDALKAAIAGDIAAIETAQLNLDYATIKAPFASVAGLRNVDVGNVVSPASSLVTLTQIEPIAVDFTLPQVDLVAVQAAMQRGKPAVTAFDQDGTSPLAQGVLQVLNNQVDPTTGTIKLKARFENHDHKLWPGAFVQARVTIQSEQNAIVIPSQAVQHGPDGFYVWVVTDDVAKMRPIDPGEIQQETTVIDRGLEAGDRIVVAGQYRLTDGTHVTERNRLPGVEAQEDRP